MIETTYIGLEHGANMLGVCSDMVLIAALENRIQIYGLLNQRVLAMQMENSINDRGQPGAYPLGEKELWFGFVPIDRDGAAALMQTGYGCAKTLSEPDEFNRFWIYADPVDEYDTDVNKIPREQVFLKRSDVQAILDGKMAQEAGSVSEPDLPKSKGAETRARYSMLSIMAALAHGLRVDLTERGAAARIVELTEQIGAPVGHDTVKKYIDMIPDALDRRKI